MDHKAPDVTVPRPAGDSYDRLWNEVYGDLQDSGPTHRHMRRFVAQLLSGLDYDTVADVGCGAGHNLPALLRGRTLSRVTGLDISARALSEARRAFEGDFHQADIQEGPLEGRWDLVFCSLLLEHLQNDLDALRNIRAMTGRYLLLTTMGGNYDRYLRWEKSVGHVRNYSVLQLQERLVAAGFKVDTIIQWGFPFFSPIARVFQNFQKARREFNVFSRMVARVLYYVYFINSRHRGDLIVVLARPA